MSKMVKWLLIFILAAGIVPIMAVPSAEASVPVTVSNPGFENGLTGWQQLWPDNPAIIATSPVHSGVNSLVLNDTKIDGYYGVNSLPIPAVEGESYKVTVSAYYETNAYGVLVLAFDNKSGQSIKDTRVAVSGGPGKWSEMTVSLQAPANTASVRVRLISGLTQTGKVYFDDVKVEKLPVLTGKVTEIGLGTPLPLVNLNLYDGSDTAFTHLIASSVSGKDGSYTLSNMAPGSYVLRALRNGFAAQTFSVLVVDGSSTPLNIQMVPDPAFPPRPVSGTVTELVYGQPLQGAKISLFKETDHEATMELTASVTTNENGSYSFPAVAPSDRYFVKVEKSGYVTTREPVYVYDGPVLDADVQIPIEPPIYTAATIPKPSVGHPRLFVQSGDIPGIRAKQSMPFFQPLFANLQNLRDTQGYTSRSNLTLTANQMQTFTFPSVEEARYVRLVSRGSTGSNALAIREIEVFKNGSGGGREEVPVQGATSSAKCSNSSEFAADKAIDKDVNTLYCNFDLMGTFTLDMGSKTFIQSLDIIFNYDTSRVYLFDILVSKDNTNWKLVDLGMGGGALPPAPAGQSNIIASLLSQVNANAFAYMLDREHNLAQGQKAVNMAMNIVDTAQYVPRDYNNNTGQLLEMVALVYDWCYPLLTNEQKIHFKDAILRFAADLEMHYYDSGTKVFDFALGTGHGGEDQLFRHLLSAAIAVYDEYPNIYNRVVPEFLNKAVPVRDYFYGSDSHHQGGSYGATRYSTELWATAIFTKMGLPSPFSIKQSKVIYKQIYARRPDGQMLRDGDEFNPVYTPLNTVWHYQPLAMLAAALFNDPYIKNEFMETYTPNEMPIYEILLLDGNTASQAKPPNDLPLTHYFNDPEASMIARSGWDDVSTTTHQSSSVVAEMKIGNRRFGNHEHMDFGSFQIYYKGGLAIDSGIYSGMTNGVASSYFGPHDQYYNKRTIAHNSMLVYDPNERPTGNDGGQRWLDTGPTRSGNDAQTLQDVFGSNYKFGEVQGHAFGPDPITPDYSYIKGDLSSAYTSKMEQYQRSMMFLNLKDSTNPAAMIVFDRVVSSDPNFKKYWLLHSIEEPIIDEATKTSTIRRTDKGDSGKLVNQTLLPQASNAVIQKVGGPGHEFDVFGTNYPITPTNPNNTEEPGAWRIQLSPGTAEKEDLFLNVLQVMDGDKQPLPVQKLDAPALVGVQLADKAVLFSKSGKRQSGTVTFAVYSGSNESQFIVTDLEPGFWRIEHDGVAQLGTVTKEGNVLSFNGPAGTTYTLTSVPNITAPANAILSADITVTK
ncbi:hypothetical protein GCM10008018_40920 [Paenibacillus marchantiophytorum]|uniref:Uncharacterized protein n=1 Tax=Paenibacillus marchantiophytorum TaxID=1619310 RepID=A0ABQ1EXY4_9BACL|nr:heparin/heparin-sulfate lyase HepB [Paenibacillus marchantiophytorum]GFZ90442.1 hypothetical protein GCM10008018_40920 [Paenibacillus marchantiophytorum]